MRTVSLAADTREALLDAMEHLLARYGYKKTTMDDLARETGIGKGTIYLYFPSKEEVALCSIDRVVERVQEQLRAIARLPVEPAERLREMLRTRVLVRFDSVRAYSESLDDLFESLRPAYMARRQRYFDAETEVFAEVLRDGRRQKAFAFADAARTAQTLLLATNALLPYSLSARELGERSEIEEKINRLADLLLRGVLRREDQ
jgi:AcrR family transcriptional regulator